MLRIPLRLRWCCVPTLSACGSSGLMAPAAPATSFEAHLIGLFENREAGSTSASSRGRAAVCSSSRTRDDPMCEAVERAADAGIVVVAVLRCPRGRSTSTCGSDDVRGRHPESPPSTSTRIAGGSLDTKGTACEVGGRSVDRQGSKGPTMIDGVHQSPIWWRR